MGSGERRGERGEGIEERGAVRGGADRRGEVRGGAKRREVKDVWEGGFKKRTFFPPKILGVFKLKRS